MPDQPLSDVYQPISDVIDLSVLTDVHSRAAYFGESLETRRAVVRAIARLPAEVRDFALEHCRFCSVGQAALGYYLPAELVIDPATGSTDAVWIVLLADLDEPDEAESIVAHELAHLWLHHPVGVAAEKRLANERAASELTHTWGFSGKRANN